MDDKPPKIKDHPVIDHPRFTTSYSIVLTAPSFLFFPRAEPTIPNRYLPPGPYSTVHTVHSSSSYHRFLDYLLPLKRNQS